MRIGDIVLENISIMLRVMKKRTTWVYAGLRLGAANPLFGCSSQLAGSFEKFDFGDLEIDRSGNSGGPG